MKYIKGFLRWAFSIDELAEFWDFASRALMCICGVIFIGQAFCFYALPFVDMLFLRSPQVVLEEQEKSTKYIITPFMTLLHLDVLKDGDIVEVGENLMIDNYSSTVKALNLDYLPFDVPFAPDHMISTSVGRVRARRGDTVDYKNGTVYINDEAALSGVEINNPYGDFPYTLKRGEYLVLPDFSDIPNKARTSTRVHTERINGKIENTYAEVPAYGVRRVSEISGTLHRLPTKDQLLNADFS